MSQLEYSRISSDPALSFDDVLIEPAASSVVAKDISLKTHFTRNISLTMPFIAYHATSDAAIAAAQIGGIGIISGDISVGKQADIVRKVKRSQSKILRNMITVTPETSIIEVLEYQARYDLKIIPVVENGTQYLAGFLVIDDPSKFDDFEKTAGHYISPISFATLPDGTDLNEAYAQMQQQNVEYVALTDNDRFVGLITKADKEKSQKFPNASVNEHGNLLVAAAVGTGEEHFDRVSALIDAGVDVIVIDVPHGHHKSVMDMVTYIRRQRSGHVDVIAGNIVTTDGALALIDAGADGVIIGSSLPQLTALLNVSEVCSLHQVPVLIQSISSNAKAFAAGASAILMEMNDVSSITDAIKPLADDIRDAMIVTGCTTIKELNIRPRFVRIARQ
jgi:IMP dehydrogenase